MVVKSTNQTLCWVACIAGNISSISLTQDIFCKIEVSSKNPEKLKGVSFFKKPMGGGGKILLEDDELIM